MPSLHHWLYHHHRGREPRTFSAWWLVLIFALVAFLIVTQH
ncbi:MAG: hypothetical protein JWQ81_8549 [Amycolatopsis sp.]|jgi:hypothetical protein|nr:hypothetical protein [Amycolatopsis sp.]MCU1687810.1 hypothetical protein [Amycolatopsis sp.]